jgi:hypothetical protein
LTRAWAGAGLSGFSTSGRSSRRVRLRGLADIGDGDAVSQRVMENRVHGIGGVVSDFDRERRLLGVEFLGHRSPSPRAVLPPVQLQVARARKTLREDGYRRFGCTTSGTPTPPCYCPTVFP